MTENPMVDFQECFEQRFQLCWMLLELSRQQQHWIDTDNYGRLMPVLSQKQHLIEQLHQFQHQYPDMTETWQRERDQLPTETREACELLLQQMETCLGELNQIETQSTERLQTKLNATRQQLDSLSQGHDIHQAYKASTRTRSSRLLDIGQ